MKKHQSPQKLRLSVKPLVSFLVLLLISLPPLQGHPTSRAETIKITYLSRIREPAWAWGSEAKVCVYKNKLYIPNGYPGLAIYDISRPAHPIRLKLMNLDELGGQAGPVAVQGTRAYVAIPEKSSIAVLDVSTPSRPAVLTRIKGVQDVRQFQIRGSYLYVQGGSSVGQVGGVSAFDISKKIPTRAGRYTTDLIDPGFFVTETGMVFLARTPATATDSAKIDCVDMSRPARPVLKSQWSSSYPGNIDDMDLRENRLYCSAYWGGIWILDASDVTGLKLVASFDWAQAQPYAKSIKAFPPFVFLAQGGPQMADQKFAVFKTSGNSLSLKQKIRASTYTHSVSLAGKILFLIEQESPQGNSNPQKIIRLYGIKTTVAGKGLENSFSPPVKN